MGEITLLLEQVAGGNRAAEGRLVETIYPEMHRIAAAIMRRERPDHTLQPTALINETYLRLVGKNPLPWESRAHFLNAAAQVMRRILIDHARAARTGKRAGGQRVDLDEGMSISVDDPETLLGIDTALKRLEEMDPRAARVVELRFFGGLSVAETAQAMNTSPKTVKRDWALARAWLENELRAA